MEQQQTPRRKSLDYLANWGNDAVVKTTLVAAAVNRLATEVATNLDHYKDFCSFNFASVENTSTKQTTLCFSSVPSAEKARIARLYGQFKGCSDQEIYRKLGLRTTSTSSSTPIEAKWTYLYYKKYGWVYSSYNTVTGSEIMNYKLSAEELEEFCRMA